jgi:hypothetical protein
MKRLTGWWPALAGLVLGAGAFGAGPARDAGTPRIPPNRVLVRWKPGAAPPRGKALVDGLAVAGTHPQTHTSSVRVPEGSTVQETLERLRTDPRVLYAGPNLRRRLLTLAPPNEPTWDR